MKGFAGNPHSVRLLLCLVVKYSYNFKSLPPLDAALLQQLEAAAERLACKLDRLAPEGLGLTEMGQDALAETRRDITGCLKKYLHLLAWSLYPPAQPPNLTLIDYGGGFGLMACLAKEAAIPRVIYNDIYQPWCVEARLIAQALGCEADAYVCGDIQSVSSFLGSRPGTDVALVSVNVIEHIYNFNEFLGDCARLSSGQVVLVLSTSANPMNLLVRRRHHRQHRQWEFQDRPKTAEGGRDHWRAYQSLRREIIQGLDPALTPVELDNLTRATRGLIKDEIERCVHEFRKSGRITVSPEHPTNTCDPFTGNWEERLLDVPAVSRHLTSLGFHIRVAGGYYSARAKNPVMKLAKKTAAAILNHAISVLGSQGACLGPCFMFHASRPAAAISQHVAQPVAK
jgi:2-polyprenyl-3-methyl-5-hydroxy-6-metoxy-1,4-benzoquinol methylase